MNNPVKSRKMPLNAIETREKGELCGAMMITARSMLSNLGVTREETKEANGGEGGAVMIVETSLRVSMLMWPKVKTLPWR